MEQQQQSSITAKAAQFMNSYGKKDLVRLARQHGWRGDDARTPMLQIALYCASKGLTPEQSKTEADMEYQNRSDEQQDDQQQGQNQQQGEQQDKQQQGEQQQPQPQQGEQQQQDKQQQQGEQQQQQQGKPMQSKFIGKCALCEGTIPEGAQIFFDATAPKGKRVRHAPVCPSQQGQQQQQGQGQGQQQGQGEQGEQGEQQEQQEQEPQRAPNNKEWQAMLDAAGIDRPHPMLRKLHALAIVARLNVMLVGNAGCGKTMLAEQLARLMGYTFGLNSMTAGTSESALTGWLLPVGDAGKFEYVPAPFVVNYQNGKAVHLLDEADAADANLLLVMNAALANGYMPVPHNLKAPMIKRSETCHIIAACNTTGSGADDLFTGRTALDASTLDRFYMVRVDYAADYEATLFNAEGKQGKQWSPSSSKPDAQVYKAAHDWLVSLRQKVNSLKIPRIVSTRMFQKVRAALDVGLTLKELKADLLMAWSPDELRRAGESI